MSPAVTVHRVPALAAGALTTGALVASLLVAAPATAATSASLDYTCLPEKSVLVPTPTAFEMPVSAEIAARANGDRVNLSMTTGRPVIPDITDPLTVTIRSSMATTVDGTAVPLAGERAVTIAPDAPTDLPVLTGSVASTRATVGLTPGPLTVEFTVAAWTVTIHCTPSSTPVIQVPVDGRTATPPAPAVKPVLKAKLTKKVQRVGRAPAKVVVTLAKGKGATSQPAGTVKVTVGKRVLVTRTVTKGVSFRTALPRKLRPGRHQVTVTFTPAARSTHLRSTASTTLRVRR